MGFPRKEYWSGLPFPSPGDLPDPGIEPRSPTLQADAFTSEPPESAQGENKRGTEATRRDKIAVWGQEIQTTMSKIDKQKGYIVQHREI